MPLGKGVVQGFLLSFTLRSVVRPLETFFPVLPRFVENNSERKKGKMAILACVTMVVAGVLWGWLGPAVDWTGVSGGTVNLWRLGVGIVSMGFFSAVFRTLLGQSAGRIVLMRTFWGWMSLVGWVVNTMFFTVAIASGGNPATILLTMYLYPIWVLVLKFINRRPISSDDFVSVVLGLIGAVGILQQDLVNEFPVLPLVFGVICGIGFAVHLECNNEAVDRGDDTSSIVLLAQLVGIPVTLVFAAAYRTSEAFSIEMPSVEQVWKLVLFGVVTGFIFALYGVAANMKKDGKKILGSISTGMIIMLEIPSAAIISWLWLGRALTPIQLGFAVVIVLAVTFQLVQPLQRLKR